MGLIDLLNGMAAGLRTCLGLLPENTSAPAWHPGHVEPARPESPQLSLCPDQECAHPTVFRGERYHAGNKKGNARNDGQEYPQEANAEAGPSNQSPPEAPGVLRLQFHRAHVALPFSKRCGNFDPPMSAAAGSYVVLDASSMKENPQKTTGAIASSRGRKRV